MRAFLLSIAAVLLSAGAVAAASREVQYGPPASWVATPPAATQAEAPSGAPLKLVYSDAQTRLGMDSDDSYIAYRVKVLRPEGLTIGNIAATWNPSTDDFVVHRLNIVRDGKVVDVLAGQKFKVIERENNLDYAMLDGDLTATLQAPGLQVGDELEFAATVRRRDPTLGDRAQGAMQMPAQSAPGAYRMRLIWSRQKAVRWQATPDMGTLKPQAQGADYVLSYELRDPASAIMTDGAPRRFNRRRTLEYSGFTSWGEVSRLLLPLYEKAEQLAPDSPVRAEAAKIAAVTADPGARAIAALQLVQDRIRYVYVGLNDGNYRPAAADETWKRRFGDCKAKTVLLLALLKELGVPAEAALVKLGGDDGADRLLPMPGAFDHVLVRATIGGRIYWLDGTHSGDRTLFALPPPMFTWALPLRNAATELVAVKPEPLTMPQGSLSLQIDASAGVEKPAKVRGEQVIRGDAGAVLHTALASLSPDDLDRHMKSYWRKTQSWVEPETVDVRYDDKAKVLRLTVEGQGALEWKDDDDGEGPYLFLSDTGFAKPHPLRRPKDQDQTAPWSTDFPTFERSVILMTLPPAPSGKAWRFSGKPVNESLGGTAYFRAAMVQGDLLRVVASRRTFAPEISPAEAAEMNARLPKFDDGMPRLYLATDAWAEMSRDPKKAAALEASLKGPPLLGMALTYAQAKRWDDALRVLDKFLAANPGEMAAIGQKAMIFHAKGDPAAGLAFVEAAMKTHPEPQLEFMRAQLLYDLSRRDEALAILRRLAAAHPNDPQLLLMVARNLRTWGSAEEALAAVKKVNVLDPALGPAWVIRAEIEYGMGRYEDSLADYDHGIAARPEGSRSFAGRAEALRQLGRMDEAVDSVAEGLRWDPADPGVMHTLAAVLLAAKRPDEAFAAYDDWVARDASGEALNARCWYRALADQQLDQADADCAKAVKLGPKYAGFWDSYALVALRQGRLKAAVERYDHALAIAPKLSPSLYGRGIAKLRAGDAAGGAADLAAAKALDPKAGDELEAAGVKPPA